MRKLKFETKKIIQVQELDKLVEEVYGLVYTYQQQDDCKSRGVEYITVPVEDPQDFESTEIPFKINGDKMGVSFEVWKNSNPEEIISKLGEDGNYLRLFYERNFYPHLDMILNDLHSKGLIDVGNYVLEIDW